MVARVTLVDKLADPDLLTMSGKLQHMRACTARTLWADRYQPLHHASVTLRAGIAVPGVHLEMASP
eukprot:1143816-Pelagomonas_calceolata.AAC.3